MSSILLLTRLYPEYLMEIHPVLIPYLNPILHMAITGSDYLNLAAACERYLVSPNLAFIRFI